MTSIDIARRDSERLSRLVSDLLGDGWKVYSWWNDIPANADIMTIGMISFWRASTSGANIEKLA